jgi:signal recognition particle receptor subunit alpha
LPQAVYQSLLHISWIDKLLENIRALFTELYKDQLATPHTSKLVCNFDPYFDRQILELEQSESTRAPPVKIAAPITDTEEQSTEEVLTSDAEPPSFQRSFDISDNSRPASPAQHILTGKAGPRGSRRARKAASAITTINSFPASSGDEASSLRSKPTKGKKMRKWGEDGMEDDGDDRVLDFSNPQEAGSSKALDAIDQNSWGTRNAQGQFMLRDIGEEMDAILGAEAQKKVASQKSTGLVGSSLGTIGGLFRNVVGGKTLTAQDLDKPLKGMEDHLMKKNVAREAAVKLCENIKQDLVGTKTSNFTSTFIIA